MARPHINTPNDFGAVSLNTTDQLLDSPTNHVVRNIGNYCVLNTLVERVASTWTISEANTKIVSASDPGAAYWWLPGTIPIDTLGGGKWVAEITWDNDVASASLNPGLCGEGLVIETDSSADYAVYNSGGNKDIDGSSSAYGASYTTGDVIRIEVDCTAVPTSIEFFKNGVSQGTFTNTFDSRNIFFAFQSRHFGTATWNFGASAFAGTPTTGFKPLCTAHLPALAIIDPSAQFAVVTDTETNIVATLAAETNATNYVRVYKNRDSIENWYWQFSHDNSNAYSVALSSSTSVAFPTLSGGDAFMGAEFNCDTYFKTGSVAHTNGADTTVTHNAGNARVFILLFDRTNGGDIISYHPEYTAGKLTVFNNSVGETVDVAIKNVTTNTFDIDTGEATGTRDYLVIPETAGFVELGLYVGNGSTDGPFDPLDFRPALSINHRIDAASGYDWNWWNAASTPYNKPNPELLSLTSNAAESFYGDFDILSNGRKERSIQGNGNASGGSYVTIHIAEAPFKYARAR